MEIEFPKDIASERSSSPVFQAWASPMTPYCLPGMARSTGLGCECVGPLVPVITNDQTTKVTQKNHMCAGGTF